MVECDGLENRWARKGLVGSNPTPSAIDHRISPDCRHGDRGSRIALTGVLGLYFCL